MPKKALKHILLFVILFKFGISYAQKKILLNDTNTVLFYRTFTSDSEYNYINKLTLRNFEIYKANQLNNFFYNSNYKQFSYALFNYEKEYEKNYEDLFYTVQNPLLNIDSLHYFRTILPFTELKYIIGSFKENDFEILHTQNVGKYINIALKYNKIFSEGAFSHQTANQSFFWSNFNLNSKNNKYFLSAAYLYQKLNNQENGGIKDINLLDSINSNLDYKLIDTFLDSANIELKNNSYLIKQLFVIKSDSLKKINLLLTNKLKYSTTNKIFSDNNPDYSFYPFISNKDESIYYNQNLNSTRVGVGVLLKKEKKYSLELGSKYDNLNYSLSDFDTIFDNYSINGNLNYFFKINSLTLKSFFNYLIKGYNKNDYSLKIKLFLNKFLLEYKNNRYTAPLFVRNFNASIFYWKKSFKPYINQKLSINYNSKLFLSGVEANFLKNFIYYNSISKPEQFNYYLSFYRFYINLKLKFGKFNFISNTSLQYSQDKNIIRIPDLLLNASVFYDNMLFKKALHLQSGVDIYYFNGFYSLSYFPGVSEYALQNKIKSGFYPFLDFFINLGVKRARIFVKIEHLNNNFSGNNFYLVPDYPLQPRAIRLGILWLMFN